MGENIIRIDLSGPFSTADFFNSLNIYPREHIESLIVDEFSLTADEARQVLDEVIAQSS